MSCVWLVIRQKPQKPCPVDFYSTTDWTDKLVEEIDQKVSVVLGGVPPWVFRHRSLLKTRLGSSPMAQLPVLPCRTF